jgi:hypothetical protein
MMNVSGLRRAARTHRLIPLHDAGDVLRVTVTIVGIDQTGQRRRWYRASPRCSPRTARGQYPGSRSAIPPAQKPPNLIGRIPGLLDRFGGQRVVRNMEKQRRALVEPSRHRVRGRSCVFTDVALLAMCATPVRCAGNS